jgi:hypothetical protein
MDTKYLRAKYIDMLTLYVTKEVPASPVNDKLQDQISAFEADKNYRLKQSPVTLHKLMQLQEECNLTIHEYRWLRDVWLY